MAALNVRELGDFIRDQRRSAQISLRQLAKQAGVSNPYLSQIERGLRKPSAEILQQIAKALRISAEVLYVQAGILEEREGGEDVMAAVLADNYLTERQKQVILDIYDAFRRENEVAGLTAGPAGGAADGGDTGNAGKGASAGATGGAPGPTKTTAATAAGRATAAGTGSGRVGARKSTAPGPAKTSSPAKRTGTRRAGGGSATVAAPRTPDATESAPAATPATEAPGAGGPGAATASGEAAPQP